MSSFEHRTERLLLRSFRAEDAPVVHERVYGDAEVMRYVGHGRPWTPKETATAVRTYMAHELRHGFAFWAVEELGTGELVGDAGLARIAGGEVDLGYTLARRAWGRGYGTEVARACVDLALGRFGLGEVVALVDPANEGSLRVAERAGMVRAGTRIAYGREHVVLRARAADAG